MDKYLNFDENKKRYFDLILMQKDFKELYLEAKKDDDNLSYSDLIVSQIGASFSVTFLGGGAILLVIAFIADYFSIDIHHYAVLAFIIIFYFSTYVFITKRKIDFIKTKICNESIILGMFAYRDSLAKAKKTLNSKEFEELVEIECKKALSEQPINFYRNTL